MLAQLRTLPIISQALNILREQLPENLYYHNAAHTDDVLSEAVTLAVADGLGNRQIELLAIAAAYHDLGFVETPHDNEAIGASRAEEAMRRADSYSDTEITTVAQMIQSTKVSSDARGAKHSPLNELARYLIDADVSNFGRDDFFEKAELVRAESGQKNRAAFYANLLIFMENHEWLTPAAQRSRGQKKQENLAALRAKQTLHE